MKKLWIILLIGVSVNSYSQFGKFSIDVNDAIIKQNELSLMKDSKNQIIDLSNTKGSPYFKDFFLSGMVYAKATDESLGYQMRYNIYNDLIEVENSEDSSIVSLQKSSNYSCEILSDSFIFLEYTDKKNDPRSGYFHELTKGKITLLVKYECKYFSEKIGKPPVFKVTPAKFVTQKSYYFLSDEQLTLISTKKKKFLEFFGKDKSEINSYINKNGLKMNNDRDIIRIISYYNSL